MTYDNLKELRELGLKLDNIYSIKHSDDWDDVVDPWDYGYFNNEWFYDENGRRRKIGESYFPGRFFYDEAA